MSSLLPSTVRGVVSLPPADLDWLHQLMADWQVIADLSVSDLVLWVHTDSGRFVAAAHSRPATGATVHLEDVIGRRMPAAREAMALEALMSGQIVVAAAPEWTGSSAVREEYVPVIHNSRAIAVVTRETAVGVLRGGRIVDKPLEELADALCLMIAQGTFPINGAATAVRHGTPRVGDGVVSLDDDGVVTYASPNAQSCFHRLGVEGDIEGSQLAEAVTSIIPERTPVDETMAVVLMGRQAWLTEVEVGGVFLSMRSIPLRRDGARAGALLLVRDVSEIRRREQVLMNKDATIREIHHRVKNNLQTVSALLRMQARRATNEETRSALTEAERRVGTIATVHAALSQNVDEQVNFDEVFSSVLRSAAAVATPTGQVSTRLEGKFGVIEADVAQALATVLAELVTNAVEHGLEDRDGTVTVRAQRDGEQLTVHVIDDGVGLVPGKEMTGLGTRIVNTLVRGELRGSIDWRPAPGGQGTDVVLHAQLGEA
ncbi:MAG: histidine kinase N-terminal domain-containing protein [Actinomyces succiniciruminis]|nr:PAS domain-containing sensor histidine kinase [Actinomyces succiniciruminis]MBE6475520.1 histidine kinase [Actinomyces succiniciruminis]MBM6978601.1 histidine kinase N-terminal domain-containing protein [Actinomyces succiniciruminis]